MINIFIAVKLKHPFFHPRYVTLPTALHCTQIDCETFLFDKYIFLYFYGRYTKAYEKVTTWSKYWLKPLNFSLNAKIKVHRASADGNRIFKQTSSIRQAEEWMNANLSPFSRASLHDNSAIHSEHIYWLERNFRPVLLQKRLTAY